MIFRAALPGEAAVLLDLERAANLAALGHVFLPTGHAFPDDAVLARWEETLADHAVTVEVVDGQDGLDCFVAWDASTLRHLAVRPSRWGGGLGRAAVDLAVAAIRAGGRQPHLWCLADNHRARGLYEHLGWEMTGVEQAAVWPPHPTELQYVLPDSDRG